MLSPSTMPKAINPKASERRVAFVVTQKLKRRAIAACEVTHISLSDLARVGLVRAVEEVERTGKLNVG